MYNVTTKTRATKNARVNVKCSAVERAEFHIAVELLRAESVDTREASVSSILRNHMGKIVEQQKKKNPLAFSEEAVRQIIKDADSKKDNKKRDISRITKIVNVVR